MSLFGAGYPARERALRALLDVSTFGGRISGTWDENTLPREPDTDYEWAWVNEQVVPRLKPGGSWRVRGHFR
jgi:hypothetical protein